MALNYDLSDIEYDFKDEEKWPITNALIMLTMLVDFGDTAANPDEWVYRVMAYEQALGSQLQRATEDGWEPRPLTKDEILAHVGLKTNVFNTTPGQFDKKLAKWMRQEIGR